MWAGDLALLQTWVSRGFVRLANVPNAGGLFGSQLSGNRNVKVLNTLAEIFPAHGC
jgi:hypothetical protein